MANKELIEFYKNLNINIEAMDEAKFRETFGLITKQELKALIQNPEEHSGSELYNEIGKAISGICSEVNSNGTAAIGSYKKLYNSLNRYYELNNSKPKAENEKLRFDSAAKLFSNVGYSLIGADKRQADIIIPDFVMNMVRSETFRNQCLENVKNEKGELAEDQVSYITKLDKYMKDIGKTEIGASLSSEKQRNEVKKISSPIYNRVKEERYLKNKDIPENIAVDITESKKYKAGAALSERLKVNVKLEDGRIINGYFTEDTFINHDKQYEKMMDSLIEWGKTEFKMTDKSPEIRFVKSLKEHCSVGNFFDIIRSTRERRNPEWTNFEDIFENNAMDFREAIEIRSAFKALGMTDEDLAAFDKPTVGFNFIISRLGTDAFRIAKSEIMYRDSAQATYGSTINRRNNGMSDIAASLGVPDLVCKSVNMTTINGGKITQGTYMLNAKGIRDKDVKPVDRIKGIPLKYQYSAQGVRDISRMEVLDFLCGNLDRHVGNMFYDFQYVEEQGIILNGIQGIDNDFSFGTFDATGDGTKNYMSKLDSIKLIDREQADAILGMDLVQYENKLRKIGLSRTEVEAGMERLTALQKRITTGEGLTIVEGTDGWSKIKPSDYARDKNIWHLCESVMGMGNSGIVLSGGKPFNVSHTTLSKFKELINPPAPVEFGEAKNESSMLQLMSQIGRFKEFKAQLDKTNPEKASDEFAKMYNSLSDLINHMEKCRDKGDMMTDMDYNLLADSYGLAASFANNYIKLKPKNPFHTNGKERLHVAKALALAAAEGKQLVREETFAAQKRSMNAMYQKLSGEFQELVDIEETLKKNAADLSEDFLAKSVRRVNELSMGALHDDKMQVVAGKLQESLIKSFKSDDKIKAVLKEEEIFACSATVQRGKKAEIRIAENAAKKKNKNTNKNVQIDSSKKEAEERIRDILETGEYSDSNHAFYTKKETFFGEEYEKNKSLLSTKKDAGVRFNRSGLNMLAVVNMMKKGYALKDIFDPGQLKEERLAAGKEVLNNVLSKDSGTLKDQFADDIIYGLKNGMNQLNEGLKNMPRITSNELAKPEFRYINQGLMFLKDLGQEIELGGIVGRARNKYGDKEVNQLLNMQGGATDVLYDVAKGINTKADLLKLGSSEYDPSVKVVPQEFQNRFEEKIGSAVSVAFVESVLENYNNNNGNFFKSFATNGYMFNSYMQASIIGKNFSYNKEQGKEFANYIKGNYVEKTKNIAESLIKGEILSSKNLAVGQCIEEFSKMNVNFPKIKNLTENLKKINKEIQPKDIELSAK